MSQRKAKVISFGIQKGGTGKTTTTAIIGWLLARDGNKVLVIDCDSQGNLTFFLTRRSIYDFTHKTVLEAIAEETAEPYIYQISDNLHILPAEDRLSDLEEYVYINWLNDTGKNYTDFKFLYLLRNIIDPLKNRYDYILLDLPPNPGLMTRMGLVASDFVVALMSCDILCYEAVSRYLTILLGVKNRFNKDIYLIGILPSLIDGRAGIDTGFLEKAREEYGDWVLDSIVKRYVKIKEFAALGITDKTKADREALEQYENIKREMLERVNKFKQK